MIYHSCMLRWLYRIKFKFTLYGNQNIEYYTDYMNESHFHTVLRNSDVYQFIS